MGTYITAEFLVRPTTGFDDAEKLADRCRAGGGVLESTQTDGSRAWRFQAAS